MLSTLTDKWSPLRLPGLVAWFNAGRNYVALNATSEALSWTPANNPAVSVATTGTDEPDWSANGWGQNVPGIAFAHAAGTLLSSTASALVTPGTGTDVPFSVFGTVRPTLDVDETIACWQDSGGNSLSSVRMNTSGGASGGTISYTRTDSAGSSVQRNGSATTGFEKLRFAVMFDGSSVLFYTNGSENGVGPCDVGALSVDTFKIGAGGAINGFTGTIADLVVMNRLVSAAEYYAYERWSRRRLG